MGRIIGGIKVRIITNCFLNNIRSFAIVCYQGNSLEIHGRHSRAFRGHSFSTYASKAGGVKPMCTLHIKNATFTDKKWVEGGRGEGVVGWGGGWGGEP